MLPHVHVRLTCEKKTWHAARNVPGLSPDMVKKTTAHLRGKRWEGGCNQVAAMKRGSKANTSRIYNTASTCQIPTCALLVRCSGGMVLETRFAL